MLNVTNDRKDSLVLSPPEEFSRILEVVREGKDNVYIDPALNAKVLSIVNSSFYSNQRSITDIQEAISTLGQETIRHLALSFLIVMTYNRAKKDTFDYEYFWLRAVTAAVAAEMLCKKLRLQRTSLFTTALLMDIGIIMMYLSEPKKYLEVLDIKRVTAKSIYEIEKDIFGTDHQQISAKTLQHWGFPAEAVSLVREHHTLKRNDVKGSIVFTSHLISSLYHGRNNTVQKYIQLKEIMSGMYAIDSDEFDRFLDEVALKTKEALLIFELPQNTIEPYSKLLEEAHEELKKWHLTYEQMIMVIELKRAKEQAEALARELMQANEKLRHLALKDGLTGLYNHRYFQEVLGKELSRAKRYKYPISLIMIDIDHFKLLNDTYGHQYGDMVLKEIGRIILSNIRESDIAARYGGEEFAVILPQTDHAGAVSCAERLRQKVQKHKFTYEGKPVKVTISLGVATALPSEKEITKTAFIEMADRALYQSKNSGRNKVTTAII